MIENEKNCSHDNILFDCDHNILKIGKHKGSVLTKLTTKENSIIFSDSIEITDNLINTEGLMVGVKANRATADKGQFTVNLKNIRYIVRISEEIIKTFEKERFNASFPYMISLLNTSLLFNSTNNINVNHLDFVKGEILNHPIALLFNDSMIVGDRLVTDDLQHPVFYDAFLVSRKAYDASKEELFEFSYEPIRRLDVNFIKYILILGVEMLK
jgi:hypothetical protein